MNLIENNKYIVLIKLFKYINKSSFYFVFYFVFSTNTKNQKNIKKRFKKFYFKIEHLFFENSNQNKFIIQEIKEKNYDIDKYVIDYMKIYSISYVRGGSYINKYLDWNVILNIKKYQFCEKCGKGSFYCDCSYEEPDFFCDCCHKTQYFFTKEELKKHQIETGIKERIMEKSSICDYCGEKGHYREHCDNVTRCPGKGLKPFFYESETDSD